MTDPSHITFPFRAQVRRRQAQVCELLQEVRVLAFSPPQPGDTEWYFTVEFTATGEQEVLPRSALTNIDADEVTWEALRME